MGHRCQRCGEPAEVQVTEIQDDGSCVTVHLCPQHTQAYLEEQEAREEAAKAGGDNATATPASAQVSGKPRPRRRRSCSACGSTAQDFQETGRLGCPADYEEFRLLLVPLLEKVQGAALHVGKRPRRGQHDAAARRESFRLRQALRLAVTNEDYERAAKLRDELQDLAP